MEIIIRPCAVDDIERATNLPELVAEHAAESQRIQQLVARMNFATYRALEAAGLLFVLGAFDDDTLVGFFFLIVNESAHYEGLIGVAELFFVSAPYRGGGTGTRMLAMAEAAAREQGAVCMVIASPIGHRLDAVIPRWGYAPIDRVFGKPL